MPPPSRWPPSIPWQKLSLPLFNLWPGFCTQKGSWSLLWTVMLWWSEISYAEKLNVVWPGPDLIAVTLENKVSEKREGGHERAWSTGPEALWETRTTKTGNREEKRPQHRTWGNSEQLEEKSLTWQGQGDWILKLTWRELRINTKIKGTKFSNNDTNGVEGKGG